MISAIKRIEGIFFGICRFYVNLFYRAVKKELSEEAWNTWRQFIEFALVGCSNTVVLLVFYYIVLFLLGSNFYVLGQTLGYVAGIANSYYWNSRFVFHSAAKGQRPFFKMCICYGVTYVIQIALLYLQIEVIAISDMIAPIIAILITTPINFVMNKVFAFQV